MILNCFFAPFFLIPYFGKVTALLAPRLLKLDPVKMDFLLTDK